jgi:hypothetical protein
METDMKRAAILALLLVVAIFCTGMGGLGGQPGGTIPDPDINIQAEVRDRDGVTTSLEKFSMSGKTSLIAWRGQGQLSIPFANIDMITFGDSRGDVVPVDVKFKTGETMMLKIRSRAQFYGSTGFGAFQIKSKDLALIDFP